MRRGGLRRPAAKAGLRRPAAAVGAGHKSPQERWERGEEVKSKEYSPGLVGSGDWFKSVHAVYFEKECEIAGHIQRVILDRDQVEFSTLLTGTSTEEVLRVATGLQPPVFRVHVCGPTCDQKRSNQDLIHLISFKKVPPPGERKWEENLKDTDENPELRRRQEEWVAQQKAAEGDQRDSSHSRASSKKKKKKRSKEKKARKKAQQGRIGGKTVAKKKLVDLYSGTGLDPDPKVRRKLQRQMRKRLKRGQGSTSTSSSTSSGTSEGKEDDELLEDRSKIQKLADHGPGLLAAAVIRNMKPFVVQTTGGTWDLDMDSLPPIMSQYARCYLSPRSSGGLLREAYTLAHIGDLLLMARPAEALDALGQRLKSLELMIGGQHWSTAQRVEVVPPMEATMSSRAELQLAQKEANLDSRIKGTGSQWEKGKGKTKTKEREKGKEKGKGSGKQKDEGKKSS